jgi:hypothetical protein
MDNMRHKWIIEWEIYYNVQKAIRTSGKHTVIAPTAQDALTIFKVRFDVSYMIGDCFSLRIRDIEYAGMERILEDVDNKKAWQNHGNWTRDAHSGQCIYHGPSPPPLCIADRMIYYEDGSRYDPATGISWPPTGPIPEDPDDSGEDDCALPVRELTTAEIYRGAKRSTKWMTLRGTRLQRGQFRICSGRKT